MRRNHSKYQAMVMGNSQAKFQFYCENTTIPISEHLNLLGITIDNKLKYDKQIAKVTRKVSQQIAVIKWMRNILPLDIRKNIYQSFIAPHFNYCSDVWHFCSKSSSDKLEKVNERALRFVFKDKNSSYKPLLNKLGTLSLNEQRLIKIASTVFKMLNYEDNILTTLNELIQRRTATYNLRGKDILTLPRINSTRQGLKSWRYLAPKIWNALPDITRHEVGLNNFKKHLMKIEFNR